MNYLHDKKVKRNKYAKYIGIIFIFFIFIYFQVGIFRGFSTIGQFVFKPILVVGDKVGEKLFQLSSYLHSKKSLLIENENLKSEIEKQKAVISKYSILENEIIELEAILNRKPVFLDMVLGNVLSGPNSSLYDTLFLDIGENDGIKMNDVVFAWGNVPIGEIREVYKNSSKVVLFSSPGEETEVIISGHNTFMTIKGRGAGNFEMILPREFDLEKNTQVVLPRYSSFTVAQVDTIISDPRDAYQKALLSTPVNIFELRFVEIVRQ